MMMEIKRPKGVWACMLLVCMLILRGCASTQPDDNAREVPENAEVVVASTDSQQPSSSEESESGDVAEGGETSMTTNETRATLNDKEFTIKLADNETASAFAKLLPLGTEMSELNGNEKYVYLDGSLPSSPINPGTIEAGDVMLYGNNCLVVFYEAHPTTYAYTRIGKIEDTSGLAEALGEGSITAVFTTA